MSRTVRYFSDHRPPRTGLRIPPSFAVPARALARDDGWTPALCRALEARPSESHIPVTPAKRMVTHFAPSEPRSRLPTSRAVAMPTAR